MHSFNKFIWLVIVLLFFAGVPNRANAQGGAAVKAIKSVATSKAGIKFAELIGSYLLGKALDSIYASATAPDPKQLDRAMGDFQKDHPEYSLMLGTLRRAVKTDGTPTTRAEFEGLARDMVLQLDHSQLNSTLKQAPALYWNPSTTPLFNLPGYGLGATRLNSAVLNGSLTDPLPSEFGKYHRLNFSVSPPPNDGGLMAAKIVGAWSFSNRNNLGTGADVYILHRNGKVTEYKHFGGDEIFSFNGTYTVEGKKLTIRWELPNGLGDILSAAIEEIDGVHLKYTPDKGPLDLEDPATKTLTRISDVGHFSVVTLSNPTKYTLNFQTRWATVDGTWTPWENLKSEPGSLWSIPHQGGYFCQITFDTSFEEGTQGKTYELPFNVVASPSDPRLLDEGAYRVTMENEIVDLVAEKLTLPKPGVR